MADTQHLERLAATLSLEERQGLLEKLNSQSTLSGDPLYPGNDGAAEDTIAGYAKLPWYYRFWYLLRSFLASRPAIKIFEDHLVWTLCAKIEERAPGLYDNQRGLLLPSFFRQLTRLKEAARFFYSALDAGVNRDRSSFFGFLGSLEIADIHRILLDATDPAFTVEKNPGVADSELRQIALRSMDEVLAGIGDDKRSAMYFNARSLNCLKELSAFPFDRCLMMFGTVASPNGETCSVSVVKEHLISLNNILSSLREVPPMTLLESLFVFSLQERAGESGFDLNRETRQLLAGAEEAVAVIRDFNRKVPLAWIIRCSTRNMAHSPREISGGEDWFTVYREYWKRRTETLFTEYTKKRRYRELVGRLRLYLKGQSLKILESTQSESSPEGIPVKGSLALSFLLTFYTVVFIPDINAVLKVILIDGEFWRKENRAEYAEYYNILMTLEDEIEKFERKISPDGDFGDRYERARNDVSSLPVKRRKIQIVCEEASEAAMVIVAQAGAAARGTINILGGVLGRDTSARYDSLSNFQKIAGKDGQLITDLNEIISKLEEMVSILGDMEVLEM